MKKTKETEEQNAPEQVQEEQTQESHSSPEQQLAEELAQEKERYARLQAEFANYKRRNEEEQTRQYKQGMGKVLKAYISVMDDFQLALTNSQEGESFKKGMEMIFAKFISTGEELGLQKIPTVGQPFNPQYHEALLAEESEQPAQHILEELQQGFEFNGRVLRTAKVKVSK